LLAVAAKELAVQLESIVVGMRPRSGWEAIDLGFALVRSAARDIYAALIVIVIPLAICATVLAYWGDYWMAALLLWWAKPLLDATTLSVLARALIGERTRIRNTFFEAPVALQPHLIAALTIRRLSPSRTFTMPVRHLEGLTRKAASERIKTLTMGRRGNAQVAAVFCSLIEYALWIAGIQTFSMFSSTTGLMRDSLVPEDIPRWVFVIVVIAAQLLVEPAFAAIGFALYINRRVELEGWDLELAFRALRARAARKTAKVSALVASLFVVLLPVLASAQAAPGALTGPPPTPRQAIKEVMSNPDFDPWRPTDRWSRVDEEKEEERTPAPSGDGMNFYAIGAIIAEIMPYALGAIAAILVLQLVLSAVKSRMRGGLQVERNIVDNIELIEAKKVELPVDVVAWAREEWARGNQAGALSMLYRGALAFLRTVSSIDFPEGATEQECVALVRARLPDTPPREAFSAVARTWQRCAYAHRLPSGDDFQALTMLYARAFVPPAAEDVAA
jgi:hypothetical protein